MPRVVGMAWPQARDALAERLCELGSRLGLQLHIELTHVAPPGTILNQYPKPGTSLGKTSIIGVYAEQ